MTRLHATLLALALLAAPAPALAGDAGPDDRPDARLEALEERVESLSFTLDALTKKVDDVLWFERVGDLARIDKVYLPTVPNPRAEETYGIANDRHPFKIWCYVFVPRGLEPGRRAPLLVLPHGGVHGDFDTYYAHVVREAMERGYVLIAPEYRGSTGYGRSYQEAIDYGGLEIDDVVAARDWAVEAVPEVDPGRVGILGWSHGGLISLFAAFRHGDKFRAAYAGVPVSDLLARMGYQTQDYRDLYSADHHIGRTAYEDVDEYRRRSPVWNVEGLDIPLLIHSTTNDRDVNVVEVEHLIAALRAAGKRFEHRIYEDFPGGHTLNRSDSVAARESRSEVWAFLARHLGR